jgi:hypothetical protein
MSADGQTIVGLFDTDPAALWDPTHGTRDLKDVLANEYGLDLTGWALSDAVGISADGLTLVGNGINPSGEAEAWIATIPEPNTALLLMTGVLGLATSRRRRAS